MGKKSKSSESSAYSTGPVHEFMLAVRNAVNDYGGDDTDLQRVHKEPELAKALARVIVHVDSTHQLTLERIVEHAPNPEIRLRALEQFRVNELASTEQRNTQNIAIRQRFLQNIVEHDVDPRVRLAAAKLITNKTILAEIGRFTTDMSVGIEVVGRITDPQNLARIALENQPHILVIEILNRLRGTDALIDFVVYCENIELALIALEKVTDTVALLRISEHARVSAVREQAHRRCAGRV